MRSKIAVIGDRESVAGFRAVGFDVFDVPEAEKADSGEQLSNLISELAEKQYGIIFVTEELISASPDTPDRYRNDMLPAVIPIPGRNGSMGIGMENIHKNVEKAVGADIFND